jgi:hypothetical protein
MRRSNNGRTAGIREGIGGGTTMRAMVLIRADSAHAGMRPEARLLAEMGRFDRQLVQAGVLLAGEGLGPSSDAVRVRFARGAREIVEASTSDVTGPVAGFWLWQVRSIDEAIEWVMRVPEPLAGVSEIEIRQVLEPGERLGTGR